MSYVKVLRIPKSIGSSNRHCYWLVKDSITGKNLYTTDSMSDALYHVEQNGFVLEPYV